MVRTAPRNAATVTIPPLSLEPRLRARYARLVNEHLASTSPVAAGIRALPGTTSAFASTQAAWRFFTNPTVTLATLFEPLLAHIRATYAATQPAYALIVHDWSRLNFAHHAAKQDRVAMSHRHDVGYELLTALTLSATTGAPIAPVSLDLRHVHGVWSSRSPVQLPVAPTHHVALEHQIHHVEGLALGVPCVHIVDREADSVAVYRTLTHTQRLFVIRADGVQRVHYADRAMLLTAIPATLPFAFCRTITYQNKPAQQYIAETTVTITRPASNGSHKQRGKRPRHGPPVQLRLVISEIRAPDSTLLARWYLYTNVDGEVSAGTIALWYYWRWRIESFYKLLKSAGWNIEAWQQTTASAVSKRLAVVAMAATIVWAIQYSQALDVQDVRDVLVRLSGRQVKRTGVVTTPALLSGLWTFTGVIELLNHYTVDELQALYHHALALKRILLV